MKRNHKHASRSSLRRFQRAGARSAFYFAAALGIWLPKSYAAVLVDLDASNLATGPLPSWSNTGTLGGAFTAPAAAVPAVAEVQRVKGVTLNGTTHFYTGPAAPTQITGAGPRTIEAWILNPVRADEETIFSWGRRGGPDGSNVSFNHGLNATFGAVGHWGAPDVGWNGQAAANRWTYVVYTYDGTTTRVYSDAVLANSEDTVLNTWEFDNTTAGNPLPFRVGSQNEANGTPTGGLRGSMTIAKIRVHDEALDEAAIKAAFDAQSISFGLGDQDNDGLPTFYENQYAFLNPTDPTDAPKDQDADGLTNLQEYTAKTLPDNADTDGDGINDGPEVNRQVGGTAAATNPLSRDTDNDGLSDKAESNTGTFVSASDTGTDPLVADSDGDTFGDYQETLGGSNPNMDSSVPAADRGPIVSLSTEGLSGPVSAWPNTGSLGGTFAASGGPQASMVQGVPAISFNGTSQFYTGPAAPAFVTGNGSSTVEAWILNPTAADEETVFSWGRRGGPDGSNASFNHGLNATWGAVGRWGGPDIGWNGAENVKQGQWTHVVYTYDGPTQTSRVYADGVEAAFEELGAPLNVHAVNTAGAPLPFRVASQNEASGAATGGLRGSMSIAEVRVFDRVLDASTIASNFTAGQDKYGLVDYDNDGLPTWYERQFGFPERTDNAAQDPDVDGLTNLQEFQGGSNPTLADTDGDGLLDGAEVNRPAGATNPLLADSDQDGLGDKAETGSGTFVNRSDTGSNPTVVDSDSDGFADGQEVFAGSNPNLGTSLPTFSPDKALIDLNAASLAAGSLTAWPNSGTMGGSFNSSGENAATVDAADGVKAVSFDGGDFYNGPVTPVFLTGNASRTVDAWLFNPAVGTEESIIAWGRRGGPDGSNASYIHGTDGTFGAMGQWGAGPDVSWGTSAPKAGVWTHVAYVYDGATTTATVYMDGVQANTETMAAELNIHAVTVTGGPLMFKVGAQNNGDGSPGGQFANLAIGRVRVYDFALSGADIATKYEAEKGAYAGVVSVQISSVSVDSVSKTVSISWNPPSGRTVAVEGSSNLTSWNSVATGLTVGQFSENTAGTSYKFYRLRVED